MGKKAHILAVLVLVALLRSPAIVRSADPPYDHFSYIPMVTGVRAPQCGIVRVFDYDGNERDWDWLVEEFGAVWIEAGSGSACVTELRAIKGQSALTVWVKDTEEQPVGGVPVVFYWPDAPPLLPDHPELVGCFDLGVFGFTKQYPDPAAGSVGFGMGEGAWYCPPDGGPHTVWVGVEGSDCVHGLGMLCGTNHYHVNPTFMLTGK
jgi:hypothetical protein